LLYRYFLKSGVIFYEDEVWSQMMREVLGVSAKRFSSQNKSRKFDATGKLKLICEHLLFEKSRYVYSIRTDSPKTVTINLHF